MSMPFPATAEAPSIDALVRATRRSPRSDAASALQHSLGFKWVHGDDGMVVDLFSGGGGASLGIEMALGRPVDIAVNHSETAIQMHMANHPNTHHYQEDVFGVDPSEACNGRKIKMLWASPDCRHFSKAKGKGLKDRRIRGLIWVVLRWASLPEWQRPRVIVIENVPEILTYGPLQGEPEGRYDWTQPDLPMPPGMPDPARAGQYYAQFIGSLAMRGYALQWRVLNAADYGAPTLRKRWFLVARCDGEEIAWPTPSHGSPESPEVQLGLRDPWRTTAECVDFSLPTRSVFGRKKPLADKTLDRLAFGCHRHVIGTGAPFLVTCNHSDKSFRGHGLDEPGRTITASRDALGCVAAYTAQIGQNGSGPIKARDLRGPNPTIVTKNEHLLVKTPAVLLSQAHADPAGIHIAEALMAEAREQAVRAGSAVASSDMAAEDGETAAFVATYYGAKKDGSGTGRGHSLGEPGRTQTADPRFSLAAADLAPIDAAFTVPRYGERDGQDPRSRTVVTPAATVVTTGNGDNIVQTRIGLPSCLATPPASGRIEDALLDHYPASMREAVREVRALLARVDWRRATAKNKGTHQGDAFLEALATSLGYAEPEALPHILGLVKVDGVWRQIVDVTLRMLVPRELASIQSFPKHYVIDRTITGKRLSQEAQISKIGNSVCPEMARALVSALFPERSAPLRAAA